jgi:hypothetical protein
MDVELIAITRYLRGNGTPEELLEHAGRVCYRSESRGDPGRFLQARIREGHESIIEHLRFIFKVEQASIQELFSVYRVAQGVGLTMGSEFTLISANARTLRDMVRRSETDLALALLEAATEECPVVFQDLV